MARRRETNVFSLSFLDIMSCGFGAVILIYITINHGTEASGVQVDAETMAEVKEIETIIEAETENQVMLKNSLEMLDERIESTDRSIAEIIKSIEQLTLEITKNQDLSTIDVVEIEALKAELKVLQEEAETLSASIDAAEEQGQSLRAVTGEGDRQYLTGLNMGGRHILVLLDASTSMLDQTIVNIIRRRNLSPAEQRSSEKWQRGLRTVEWITANMPATARFQIVTFAEDASMADPDSDGQWLSAETPLALEKALSALTEITPKGGSNLHSAFRAIENLDPLPDNVFLITDGLPTQGERPARGSLVSARERLQHFTDALATLNLTVPINVILLPMEGDPVASPSFWRLAQITGGAFLSPARDWP
ncbi:MAG: hypothetical protein ACPHAN_02850 [Pseudomonadales bacterium]